jgi:hypothetical protein
MDNMRIRHFGQLLTYNISIVHMGRYYNILTRYYTAITVIGLLQESPATTQQIKELLGMGLAAHRPQACPLPTGHNHTISVVVHILEY